MESSESFTGLIVWQKAHQFTVRVYVLTRKFPRDELYGLTAQLRRAAVSVSANIAEGYSRKGKKDKLRFYNIADASLQECKYYLILTRDLNYAADAGLSSLADEVGKILCSYSQAIRKSP